MARLHKNKNLFQKLALPLAVIVTAVNVLALWYVYYYKIDFVYFYYYEKYVKYAVWVVYEVVFFFSFAANNATEFARHVMYYFIAAAVGCAAVFIWAENCFDMSKLNVYWQMYLSQVGDYKLSVFRRLVLNSVVLVFCGALFCGIKYKNNNSGWLRKHTY